MNHQSVALQDTGLRDTDPPGTLRGAMSLPSQLLLVARRRWRLLVAAIVIGIALAIAITLLMTPQFTATTRLEIAREGDRVVAIQGVQRESNSADLEFYQTQYGLLGAASLAERVARDLKLAGSPDFFAMFKIPERKIGDFRSPPTADVLAARERAATEILLDHVTVVPIRGSSLVDIRFTSPDAQFSAKVSNAWAQNFIASNLERRFDASSYARRVLEGRLKTLRERLEQSERQAVGYSASQGITNIPGTVDRTTGATLGERSLVADQLGRLNEALSEAVADRIKAESDLQRAQSTGASDEALRNNAITAMRERRASLAADYAKLMQQFDPAYPAAKLLQSQIASLDQSISREVGRVAGAYSTAFQAATRREQGLRDKVSQLKAEDTDLRRRSIQFNIFQRDVDTNRQLYDALLQRYKEIGVAGGIGTNNIAIIDDASVPEKPSRPSWKLNLLLGVLAGVIAGLGAAWLREQTDDGVNDPSDVASLLGIPLLGTVPKAQSDDLLVELNNRRSLLVEAYLAIQTSLELSTANGAPHSIAVTSTRPREGKSTTSYALAHSLARSGRRVVLIDADMRAPMVHNEFKLSNEFGLSNLLAAGGDWQTALQQTASDNLRIITAGPLPPNAAELLTGNRLRQLIENLLTQCDNVVVDCPPVMGLADAALIANAVDGTVYTIESHAVRVGNVRVALGRLRAAHTNVLGVVLTKFDTKNAHESYGYDYGYHYGNAVQRQT